MSDADLPAPHLCHVFSTFSRGGPQIRAVDLINAAGPRFRHTIVAMDNDLACRDRIDAGVDVEFRTRPDDASGLRATKWAATLLREAAPGLLLTYNWGAMDAVIAARWTGVVPVVHAEDGFNPDEVARQKHRRVLARRFLLRRVAGVVVPSRTLETIARETWKVPASRLHYVPNGVDLDRFRPGEAAESTIRSRLDIPADAVLVGTVGHLSGSKNVGHLLRAIAEGPGLADVWLLVVGEGPQRSGLEDLAKELGISDRVRFAGEAADPLPHLRAMDVFALGSRTEQMPIAVLEAMGVGLPIVGTDVGDVKGMVAPANADLIVPLSDRTAFADGLSRLAADARLRASLGSDNRTRCEAEFDLENMRARYEGLYRESMST